MPHGCLNNSPIRYSSISTNGVEIEIPVNIILSPFHLDKQMNDYQFVKQKLNINLFEEIDFDYINIILPAIRHHDVYHFVPLKCMMVLYFSFAG